MTVNSSGDGNEACRVSSREAVHVSCFADYDQRWWEHGVTPEHVTFSNAPVHRVTLSILFDPINTISSLHLARLKIDWSEELPIVEERTPLAAWGSSTSFSFVDNRWPMPACLFWSNDRQQQVLIQDDRFLLTWHFSDDSKYPGFSRLIGDLASRYGAFVDVLRDTESPDPDVKQVSINYENYFPYVQSDSIVRQLVLGNKVSAVGNPETATAGSIAIRKRFEPGDPPEISMELGIDPATPVDADESKSLTSSVLQINGSADAKKNEDPVAGLRMVHAAIIGLFVSLFDDETKALWGERND